jgi:hypothetical protein
VKRFSIVAAVAVCAALIPASGANGRTADQPTVTMEQDCSTFPGFNSVKITLSGFPPFTPFHGELQTPDGGGASGDFETDANGEFVAPQVGVRAAGTWTVTITWSGGTITRSLFVDCPKPAPFRLSVKLLKRPQTSLRRVMIEATCRGSDCEARARGALRVRHPSGFRRYPLGTKTRDLHEDVSTSFTLRIPEAARAAARHALAHGRRVTIRTRVRAHDTSDGTGVRVRERTVRVVP